MSSQFIYRHNYILFLFVIPITLERTTLTLTIKARETVTTKQNPCKVNITIFENLIVVNDNSGGIKKGITDRDLFKIGNNEDNNKEGIGMKKSFCSLGNKIDVISNRKDYSRKFTMDLDYEGEELISSEEIINYNCNIGEGTTIYITNLEKNISKQIQTIDYENKIVKYLGRMYLKFIDKGKIIIKINNYFVKPVHIEAEHIDSQVIFGKYYVDLYKGDKGFLGMDIFVSDYMVYNRIKSK